MFYSATVFLVVMAIISMALGGAVVEKKFLTAGDPNKFVADATIIANGTYADKGQNGWVMYKQCDSRWANQELGNCWGTTICSSGCAMTSVAMMLATRGVRIDPAGLDSWLTQNGGYANGCDICWDRVDAFGASHFVGIQWANEWELCNGINAGSGIIANVNNGGHWVLLTGCAGGGNFYVNDPGYNRNTYHISEIGCEAVYH
jgi:hypothetical protein